MFVSGLLSGILGRCFFKGCYNLFGEMMDALALLNGAINFVLYCSMSRQFRTTFGQMMRNKCGPTYRANSQTELQTTYVWPNRRYVWNVNNETPEPFSDTIFGYYNEHSVCCNRYKACQLSDSRKHIATMSPYPKVYTT